MDTQKEKKRREALIDIIVSAYLKTGKPVSSGYVSENCGMKISPATVRNIMKEMEDEGFLTQPHTSAGRVPTVKCYRYYVKYLMPQFDLSKVECHALKELVERVIRENDVDVFMEHVASVLSQVTDLIGVTISPMFENGIFDRLEILTLGGSRYLIVISLKSGLVKTIHLTVDRVIPRTRTEETARLITQRLQGLTVAEIKRSIGTRVRNIGGDRKLVDVILHKRELIFTFPVDNNVYVAGLSRLLSNPDFPREEYSLKLAGLVEHKCEIADALRRTVIDIHSEDVAIDIGGSGLWGTNPPLSLISATYCSGDVRGAVGIIGPTRIQYPRLRAIIKYTASTASHFFSS